MDTLSENFNTAVELFEDNLSHEVMINYLKTGNIVQRQVCALKLSELKNQDEALVLCKNLTGQDGKIREAVSLKICELIPKYSQYFLTQNIYNIMLNAIIDVNPNVCRNIILSLLTLRQNKDFLDYFITELIKRTQSLIDLVKNFDFQDGKYKVNKEVFKLYWYLQVIYEFADDIPLDFIKNIIRQTQQIDEYTIREKTAKILSKNFDDAECKEIQNKLKFDKNYYVRRF